MPQPLADVAAEQIVLGAMMLSQRAADEVLEILTSADFYQPAHAAIYVSLLAALAGGEPTDPTALAGRLLTTGDLQRVGGGPYLHDLVTSVPMAANATYYARMVADFAIRRRIAESAVRIHQVAADLQTEVPDVVNGSQALLHAACQDRDRKSATQFGDGLEDLVEEVLQPAGPDRGLSTGVGALDDSIGGLKPGQLVVVAGRPGVGKSVLLVDFARSAVRRGKPVLLFSLEMSRNEIRKRVLAAECEINLSRILHGGLRPYEAERLRSKWTDLRGVPFHIDDSPQTDLAAIRGAARRLQQRHGLALVAVDYLQLMTSARREDSRVQEVGAISRGLKLLAKELELPVVAAAQLNRLSEMRSDKRPQLADIRESGSVEQDSDIVILLHRPDYHEPEHVRAGEIDLIIAKNRNGPQETVTAIAQLDKSRIVDAGVPEIPDVRSRRH